MSFQDHFSQVASSYSHNRPGYPPELFEFITSHTPERQLCWDCATGNGQAATKLAKYFDHVIATDGSPQQIENAFSKENINYQVALAENSGLEDSSVNLVTVAQAIHWLDHKKFNDETLRVLKKDGLLAIWTYSDLKISEPIDPILKKLYDEIRDYWPPEVSQRDDGLFNLPFPFQEIKTPLFEIQENWSSEKLLNYIDTWSATKNYLKTDKENFISKIKDEIIQVWGAPEDTKKLSWTLRLRLGKKI